MKHQGGIFEETALDRWLWRLLGFAGVMAWIMLLGWMQGNDERNNRAYLCGAEPLIWQQQQCLSRLKNRSAV